MATKIKVSEETTIGLTKVKRGDIVKSIYYGGIVLVVRPCSSGTFSGIVLDKGNYGDWGNMDYVSDLNTGSFVPFIGKLIIECE